MATVVDEHVVSSISHFTVVDECTVEHITALGFVVT